MTFYISRRKFLNSTAAGVGAAGLVSAFPWAKNAHAAIGLNGVQWGGPWDRVGQEGEQESGHVVGQVGAAHGRLGRVHPEDEGGVAEREN